MLLFTPLRRFTQLFGWSPENAGQHQLKNGIVQHSFGFLAGVHVERTNSCIALHNLASFLPYGTLTVDCRAFL